MKIIGNKGQAAVEMVVVMPVMLAVLAVAVNFMIFLGDCARFDRIAAEAVRTQAASPGYDSYDLNTRANNVRSMIGASFVGSNHLTFSVTATQGSSGSNSSDGSSTAFSLLPKRECFICQMNYSPWGFGNSFFGVSFSGIPHARSFEINPYRPGVLF